MMRDFMLRSPDAGDLGPSGGGGGGEGRPFGGLKFRGPGTMVSPGQKKNVTLVRTKDSNGSFEQQPDGSYRYVHPSGNANADIASYFHLVSSGSETTFETPATSGSNPVDGSGEFLSNNPGCTGFVFFEGHIPVHDQHTPDYASIPANAPQLCAFPISEWPGTANPWQGTCVNDNGTYTLEELS